MAVQLGVIHRVEDILSRKIDFTFAYQTEVVFRPPTDYKVLTSESREPSFFDSPSTSTGDHFISSGVSVYDSSTNSSSPLSITKELTVVSSPLTPCSDNSRSKSKSPSLATTSFLCDDSLLIKSVADVKPDTHLQEESTDVMRKRKKKKNKKKKQDQDNSSSLTSRLSSSSSNSSVECNSIADTSTDRHLIDQHSEKAVEPVEGSRKRHMLVEYEDSDSDKDESKNIVIGCSSQSVSLEKSAIDKIIGPLKPSAKPEVPAPIFIGPVLPVGPIPATVKSATNPKRLSEVESPLVSKRKRLLSERGEREAAYPVMDKTTISNWNWDNCSPVRQKDRASGLYNSSNDCFLNAVLQLISHTAPLARYILEKHPNEKCYRKPGECICCAMRANHFQKALNGGAFMASWIRSHLRRIFPSHIHGMQEDAHELLSLMLDALDYPVGALKNQGAPSGVATKPSTPIEQIFGGTLRNFLKCAKCGTTATYYERIRELNLAIRRKPDGSGIHIPHLVDFYFKDENISSECKKCGRGTDHLRRTKILRPPAVLLIQLKRFNSFGGKIRLPVSADLEIDVSRHMYDSNHSTSNTKYILTSVVEHLGSGIDHGHYIAYSRGFNQRQWYLFDDEQVTTVSADKVRSSSNPYLLVYSRRCDLDLPKLETLTSKPNLNGYQSNKVKQSNGYARSSYSGGYSSFQPKKQQSNYRPSLI